MATRSRSRTSATTASRLADRSASPAATNKLFFFFTMEMQPRTVGGDVTRYRMPTLLERQGDFSKSTNNLGQPYPYIKDPQQDRRLQCDQPGRVFQRRRRAWQDSAERALRAGHGHPELVSAAEPSTTCRSGRRTTSRRRTRRRTLIGYQPVIRLDYQPFPNLRGSFKFFEYQQPADPDPGHSSGLERHARRQLRHLGAGRERQLDHQQHDVRRVLVGRQLPPPGRLLGDRRRAELLPQRAAGQRDREPQYGRLRRDSVHLPGRDAARPRPRSPTRSSSRSGTTIWDGYARAGGAVVHVGRPRRQLAAEQHRSLRQLHSGHAGQQLQRQRHAADGRAHGQGRLLLLQQHAAPW